MGEDVMNLDELLAKHPVPWTYSSRFDAVVDAKDEHFGCLCGELFVAAVNRIGELQREVATEIDRLHTTARDLQKAEAERDELEAKCEQLFQDLRWENTASVRIEKLSAENADLKAKVERLEREACLPLVSLHDQQRLTAACAAMTGILASSDSEYAANPQRTALSSKHFADALLSALKTPKGET